mmetsp:Transcript_14715/g.31549  ORF Transcript_14715/g.31549 Transcript_14715/m.31549 type:complete len:619 (-) Transcript_14715:959-2815(-)
MAKGKAIDESYDSYDSRDLRRSAETASEDRTPKKRTDYSRSPDGRRGRSSSRGSYSSRSRGSSYSRSDRSDSRSTRSYSTSRSRSRSRSESRSRSRSHSRSGSDSDASVIRNRSRKDDNGSREREAGTRDAGEDGDIKDDEGPRKSTQEKGAKGVKKGEIEEEDAALQSQGRDGPSTTKTQKGEALSNFKRTLEANHPPALTYLSELGSLAETANASRLQLLLKKGSNKLSTALTPKISANGLRFKDLEVNANHQVKPIQVPTCVLTIQQAKAVPVAGLEDKHSIVIRRARLCLYDGTNFVGNVQTVDHVTQDPAKPWNWTFKTANSTFYVRHAPERRDGKPVELQVYLEVTVGFKPDSEALHALSRLHRRKAAQVDEVAVAWCVFPLLSPRVAEQTLEVKMAGGDLSNPAHVSGPPEQQALTRCKLWNKLTNKLARDPMVQVRMARVPDTAADTVSLLPPVLLIQPSLASMAVTYRGWLAKELLDANGDVHSRRTCNPVLGTLPAIMDDDHLYATLATLWHQKFIKSTKKAAKAEEWQAKQEETLQAVCLRVWPLIYAENLPPPSLSSDQAHAAERIKVINQYMEYPAVASLSQDSAFYSTPFDIAELSNRYTDCMS